MNWNTIPPERRQLAERILTRTQLRILQLRLSGHSHRTIAIDVGLDESTVRYHYARALKLIRQALEEEA